MKGKKVWKSYLVILLGLCMVVVLSSLKIGSSNASGRRQTATIQSGIPVRSFARDAKVVGVEVQESDVLLTLSNGYHKTITAFVVSSNGVISTTDMIDTDQIVPPGGTVSGSYALPKSSSPQDALAVRAVMFEDGTADGDATIIRKVLDTRAGQREQVTRIIPLLQAAVNGPVADLREQWRTIKSQFAALPDEEKGQSFAFNAGLQDAKNLAIHKISNLEMVHQERGDEIARRILVHLKETYEERNRKLGMALRRNQ